MTMRIALAFLTTLARQISRRVGGRVHYGAPFVGLVDQPSPLKAVFVALPESRVDVR